MRIDLTNYHSVVFDFDGVFTDNFLFVDEKGIESVRVSRSDGYAIDLLRGFIKDRNLELSMSILSTETNPVVARRAEKMQLPCISGKSNKLQVLRDKFFQERPNDLDPFAGLIYFGNDLNDLPVILSAGISIVPKDAHPSVKKVASHTLNSLGGHDFVRQGVEFLLGIEAMSLEELSEFISNC
jgi:3-deoxy-D-manno-octulosonate 8-phosphate phosphatase (KDO 8-P phosphatase)